MGAHGTIRIGTSGYVYAGWRGPFYPRGLPHGDELAYACRAFQSIEINRSFYRLLSPAACRAWHDQAPPGFVFALKGSRFITHMKKLRGVEQALANFFAAGPLALGHKLGPIVWQLPATMRFDAARLADFLALLPRSTEAAARLAQKHDARLARGAAPTSPVRRVLRHVLEARHESFASDACLALLARHAVALCVSDSPDWPLLEARTAPFAYVRLHGAEQLYVSRYGPRALARWAERIRGYARHGDVYVYFDNDTHAHAPRDAQALIALLGQGGRAQAEAR